MDQHPSGTQEDPFLRALGVFDWAVDRDRFGNNQVQRELVDENADQLQAISEFDSLATYETFNGDQHEQSTDPNGKGIPNLDDGAKIDDEDEKAHAGPSISTAPNDNFLTNETSSDSSGKGKEKYPPRHSPACHSPRLTTLTAGYTPESDFHFSQLESGNAWDRGDFRAETDDLFYLPDSPGVDRRLSQSILVQQKGEEEGEGEREDNEGKEEERQGGTREATVPAPLTQAQISPLTVATAANQQHTTPSPAPDGSGGDETYKRRVDQERLLQVLAHEQHPSFNRARQQAPQPIRRDGHNGSNNDGPGSRDVDIHHAGDDQDSTSELPRLYRNRRQNGARRRPAALEARLAASTSRQAPARVGFRHDGRDDNGDVSNGGTPTRLVRSRRPSRETSPPLHSGRREMRFEEAVRTGRMIFIPWPEEEEYRTARQRGEHVRADEVLEVAEIRIEEDETV